MPPVRTSSLPVSSAFAESDIRALDQDFKVGLLATVNPQGLPHVTLITSLQAKNEQVLTFGQFTEGSSKVHLQYDPRVGFLVMTPDKQVWRGQARWTHRQRSGYDCELYNRKPIFRYHAYFGVPTVHYLDLITFQGPGKLSVHSILAGELIALLASVWLRPHTSNEVLKPWAQRLLSRPRTMKFLSWVGVDGYPTIVPVVPCRAAGRNRLLIAPTVYNRELTDLGPGRVIAAFALNRQMESVLVRGILRERFGLVRLIDIDWVYNSMPPKHGQIYPQESLRPVTVRAEA